jgi:hypothetical protein
MDLDFDEMPMRGCFGGNHCEERRTQFSIMAILLKEGVPLVHLQWALM